MKYELKTRWGENIDPEQILHEYPRLGLVRESCIILNGFWKYAITDRLSKLPDSFPANYNGDILVPFSPEAPLSGVGKQLKPDEYLWYFRNVDYDLTNGKRLLLHFEAIDQSADIYINREKAFHHEGGYYRFSVDITRYLSGRGSFELHVRVTDATDTSYLARGKQKLHPGGMFYTPQSGIWQTVWMEYVPEKYISDIRLTPDYDNSCLQVEISSNNHENDSFVTVELQDAVLMQDTVDAPCLFSGNDILTEQRFSACSFCITIRDFKSWSPEKPYLYHMKLKYGDDVIITYFAMRKFSVSPDTNGIPRLTLNNMPYFHNGVLDQGYWPDGLYTAPSDEAMVFDIVKMKEYGFNMLRKHAKIEPQRWYFHCDRLGMLVWQDIVNGGDAYKSWFVTYFPTFFTHLAKKIKDNHVNSVRLSRATKESRECYYRELDTTVRQLYNFPCIAMWVPFNEAWGQFDALNAVKKIRKIDSTRTIDHASGWFDQQGGDVKSLHIYFTAFKFKPEKKRALVLSEFGGYSCPVPHHITFEKEYGYRKFRETESLTNAFRQLYEQKIIPGMQKGLCAAVYTQLSDIEEEINGLLTYDRKVLKVSSDVLRSVNRQLQYK